MNRKMTALSLAIVATLTLSGCATGSASGNTNAAAQAPAQGSGRGQGNMDPQLQQLMQDQRKSQQQIEQLLQQIHTDAGLPAPTNNNQQQAAPGQQGNGNGGQGYGGQGPRNGGQAGQGAPGGQDLQAAKDLLNQEQQAATDLITKLTSFDDLVKQATGNQKALKDAQTLFAPIEESLQVGRGGPGGFRGQNGNTGGRTQGFGLQNRTDLYQSAASKVDAAITQLKSDLGK